jgi:uncharacterized membrane protein
VNAYKPRSKTVTVVSWIIIAKGAWLFFPTISLLFIQSYGAVAFEELRGRGLSPTFHIAWSLVGSVVHWAAAALMLSGFAFGRLLYVSYVPTAFAVSACLFGIHARDVVAAVVFIVFAVVLFRPAASDSFRWSTQANTTGNG